jgi:hypothetical protein
MLTTGILETTQHLPGQLLSCGVRIIKHLATSPQIIEVLFNANAMEILVKLLSKHITITTGKYEAKRETNASISYSY